MLAAGQSSDDVLVFVCVGWWVVAAAIGTLLGRRAAATPPIARVLADAKNATMLPEHRPGSRPAQPPVAAAGEHGDRRRPRRVIVPQVTGIATGFAIIWALAWRKQDGAVAAIEERDGVTLLRRADLAGAPDPARAHAGLPARGAVAQRVAVTDVLVVSLGVDRRLADVRRAARRAIERAGATARRRDRRRRSATCARSR